MIEIGEWHFDHHHYDRDADVLYLSIGEPRRAIGEETPEGHILRYDQATGEFCGVTLIGVRQLLERGEEPAVTVPRRESLHRDALDKVFA